MKGEGKIRVLRIINRFNIGGPTFNATFLTRYLSDDFETLLIGGLPDEGEADSLYILEKYGVKPLLIEELKREPSFSDDRKAYKKIKQIISEFKPQIVHTHAAKAGALGRRAAKSMKVPVVVHTFHGHVFHSYFGKLKTELFKAIERRLAKSSDGIIAISDSQRKELSLDHKICKSEKIKVIPLGFDLAIFNTDRQIKRETTRNNFGISNDEVAIAIIGRLAPVKDHNFFLEVAKRVLESTAKKVRFFIVGNGSEWNTIKEKIDQIDLNFPNRILMTSWIRDIDVFNPGMDIICLTSKNEGTPVSLIEAQASGVPVITRDVGGVRDIVLHGETGYVVPRNDLDEFVKCVVDLVEDEKKRQKMSQNGWTFVEHKFHYKRLVSDMEKYYRDLLKIKG